VALGMRAATPSWAQADIARRLWAAATCDKHGGARVIHILRNDALPIFLISVYTMKMTKNLTRRERSKLQGRVDRILA